MSYLPGKPIVLSRLPAQEWFSTAEAARWSGWGKTFIIQRIGDGTLPAQEYQRKETHREGAKEHKTYRIHIDDLALFIIRHGANRISEEKHFADVALIVRCWPAWMRRELVTFVQRSLPEKPTPPAP